MLWYAPRKKNTSPWSTTVSRASRFPTEYLRGVLETGGLFRIGIKLMMACGTTSTDMYGPVFWLNVADRGSCSDYIPLVNLLGVYFQIRDDYMNLQSTEVGSY